MPKIQTKKKTETSNEKHSIHIPDALFTKMGFLNDEEINICYNVNSQGVKQLIITGLGFEVKKTKKGENNDN